MLLLTTYSAFSVGGNLWGLAFPPHSGQRGADRQHTECKPEASSGTKDAQHYHGLNFLNQTRGLSPLFSSCWTSTTLHLGFGPLQERHQMEESSLHAHSGQGNRKSGGRILPFLERRIAGIQETLNVGKSNGRFTVLSQHMEKPDEIPPKNPAHWQENSSPETPLGVMHQLHQARVP